MALNGDGVVAEGERKAGEASRKMLRLLNDAMEKGAGALVGKMQGLAAQKEKQRLMESYGVTKEFQKYMANGGQMQSFMVHKKDYVDFAQEMKKRDVPFLTSEVLGDDCYNVMYRASDKDKVELAIKAFEASRSIETEMTADRFCEKYAGRGIYSIEGIDLVELELIRHYAAQSNFQYAVEAIDDGSKCKILFSDKAKMDSILKKAAWQLTGERGPLAKQQIEYRIAGRESSNRILTQQEAEKEFYIVSKTEPSNYIHITANDLELYKDNMVVTTVAHDDAAFYDKAVRALCGMDEPVILAEDEWMSKQRCEIIEARQEVIPTGASAADKVAEEIKLKDYRAWEVLDNKLSLDNSYSLRYDNPMMDPSISYSQFFETECSNDRYEDEVAHAAAAATYLYEKKLEVNEEYAPTHAEVEHGATEKQSPVRGQEEER